MREVYWPRYAAGQERLANEEAREFIVRANHDGRTARPWSASTIRRVAGYLTGCCADFGLLEPGPRKVRKFLPWRMELATVAALAYDLHWVGHGDNAVVGDSDWQLYGLDRLQVLDELKRLALRRFLVLQTAGTAIRIAWPCKTVEELVDVLAQG
jgi:hypothetical protein